MRTRLDCPCGLKMQAPDEDALVEVALAHLREAHPDLEYQREHILFMAY